MVCGRDARCVTQDAQAGPAQGVARRAVEASRHLRAAPDAVFALLVAVQSAHAWRGVVRWEPLSNGALAAGSRIEETRNVLGKPRSSVLVVEAFERPRRLVLRREDGSRLEFRLEAEGGGTRVTLRDAGLEGFAAGLLAPFRRRARRARLESQLAALEAQAGRRR